MAHAIPKMGSRHVQGYRDREHRLNIITLREMQIKPPSYQLTTPRMFSFKRKTKIVVVKMWRNCKPYTLLVGM